MVPEVLSVCVYMYTLIYPIREKKIYCFIYLVSYATAKTSLKAEVAHNPEGQVNTCPATNKQTPWPLVRERTIPTDRPPLVDEI
jgi:hypothetical protein